MYQGELYQRAVQGDSANLQARYGGHDTEYPQFTEGEHRSVALEVLDSWGRTTSLPEIIAEVNVDLAELRQALKAGDEADAQARQQALARKMWWLKGYGAFPARSAQLIRYTEAGFRAATEAVQALRTAPGAGQAA